MYSLWFYFMPTGTTVEAQGYATEEAAYRAIANGDTTFTDVDGNGMIINRELQKTAIIKVARTTEY